MSGLNQHDNITEQLFSKLCQQTSAEPGADRTSGGKAGKCLEGDLLLSFPWSVKAKLIPKKSLIVFPYKKAASKKTRAWKPRGKEF